MARRPSKQGLSTGILVVLLAGVLVSQALQVGATHQPADKAAASGRTVEVFGTGVKVPILSATMKTSKPQDLVFSVTLECSIITQTFLPGGETATRQSADAEGRIRVWVEIDEKIVPISTPATEQPNTTSPAGEDSDKVTFCNRFQEHEQADQEEDENDDNPNCTGAPEDPPGCNQNDEGDGLDEHRLYLRTKDANAFNWIYMNAGSAVHDIVVYAELTSVADSQECTNGEGEIQPVTCAEALIGNRTLTVFPERFANDATVV